MKEHDTNVLPPSPAAGAPPGLNNATLTSQQRESSKPAQHPSGLQAPSTAFAPQHRHCLCKADVSCRAPAAANSPQSQHTQRSGCQQAPETPAVLPVQLRVQQNSHKQALNNLEMPSESLPMHHDSQVPTPSTAFHTNPSSADSSCSTDKHVSEAGKQLLWWPLDHVTLQGSRLAVGDSCYVITGDCVVCNVDDELAMVECTCCKRFTHFHCACPKLTLAPQVTSSACTSQIS